MRRYSRSDASVSMAMTRTPSGPVTGSKPDLAQVERGGQVALGVDLAGQRAPPLAAASSARPAATVVLPTPPLPVTTSRRRSSRRVCGDGRAVDDGAAVRTGISAEADPALAVGPAELDVGDALGGHAHVAAQPVGHPQHLLGAGEHAFDAGLERLTVDVARQFDGELFGGLDDADAQVHG